MEGCDFKVGDLILMKGNGTFSRLVRFSTGSDYTHVCVYIGYGAVLDVDGFRKASIRPIPSSGGFEVYRPRRRLLHFEQDALFMEAMRLIDETKGYDWGEALRLFFHRIGLNLKKVGHAKRHLCTELCAELYRRIGLKVSLRSLEPESLARLDLFERVFPHVAEDDMGMV
ncbi:hypothetical protein ACQR3P_29460 [Rhodococcus sp. IEGM1300]